jgi:hypothetical protein
LVAGLVFLFAALIQVLVGMVALMRLRQGSSPQQISSLPGSRGRGFGICFTRRAAILYFYFSRRIPPSGSGSGSGLDLYRPVDLFTLTPLWGSRAPARLGFAIDFHASLVKALGLISFGRLSEPAIRCCPILSRPKVRAASSASCLSFGPQMRASVLVAV